MKNLLILSLVIFNITGIDAQDVHEDTTSSSIFSKKNVSIAIISGVYLSTMIDSYNAWWKDDKQPFKFSNGKQWFLSCS